MKSFVFFNNKGGVGKTTLTFNVAHMMARLGLRVVLVDFDPQCNLSAMVLREEVLADLWERPHVPGATVASCVDAVRRGRGTVIPPRLQPTASHMLWLLPGDLSFSRYEQTLAADGWGRVAGGDERAVDVVTSLEVLIRMAADAVAADVAILDVGPSLGALNHAALIACDAVVVPVAPDLFSLQGLRNVGPTLREWRDEWKGLQDVLGRKKIVVPWHPMKVLGYVVQQHLARSDRPVAGYKEWVDRIPTVFHEEVLGGTLPAGVSMDNDPMRLALLKHFASLVPLAQSARKPIFDLKAAEGVGGGQLLAVAKARQEFELLAKKILKGIEVEH